MRAPKPCIVHRCPEYALEGKSRCQAHETAFESSRRADPNLTGRRGTSAEWRRARGLALWRANYRCRECGVPEKLLQLNDETLEVHHVDGDPSNHRQSNLRPLCPNCHRNLPKTEGDRPSGHLRDDAEPC